MTTCAEVSKPRGLPPGQVVLGRYRTVQALPFGGQRGPDDDGGEGGERGERREPAKDDEDEKDKQGPLR